MLKFFYFGTIEQPENRSISFFIQMLSLADKFLAMQAQEETLKILHNGTSRITRDNILVFFTQNADVFNTIQLKQCFFLLLVQNSEK